MRRNPNAGAHNSTAQPAHAVDAASRPQDPSFFEGWYRFNRLPDLSVAAQLMGIPFGVRGTWLASLFYVMSRIALVERPLCPLRRAGTRGAEVVRWPVVRSARYAARDTKARCAECPLCET